MPYWDFEGKRLTEVDTEFPNVNGLCKGKQYDLLLYDDRFVCGYDFPAEGSGSGQMPEELFAWTDSDINGYFVEDLRTLGEDRYYRGRGHHQSVRGRCGKPLQAGDFRRFNALP